MKDPDDQEPESESVPADGTLRSDCRLVDGVLTGDRAAIAELENLVESLIPRHTEHLLHSVRFAIVNRVLQDLMLEDCEGLRRWHRQSPLRAYLRILITRNIADYAREKWGRGGIRRHDQLRHGSPSDYGFQVRSPVDPRPDPHETLWREEFRADYEKVKARLSPDHLAVWVLRHEDDRSIAEIAEQLGRTVKSIDGLLRRAKDEFRRIAAEIAPHILPE